LSESPKWLLVQTGYLYIQDNLRDWYNLAEDDWYCIIRDINGKVVHSTSEQVTMNDAVEFVFHGVKDHYPVIVGREERPLVDNATAEPEAETMPTAGIEYKESFWDPTNGDEVFVEYITTSGYEVTVGIRSSYTGYYKIHGLPWGVLQWLFAAKYPLVAFAAVSFILFAVAFIFLLSIAGKDPKTREVNPGFMNRLPLDLYLAVAGFLTVLGCMAIYELLDILTYKRGPVVLALVLMCGCGIGVATLDMGFFTALAAQVKLPGYYWFKNSVCGRVLRFCWKYCRLAGSSLVKVFRMLPIIWQWIAAGGVLGIILLTICAGSASHWYSVFPLFLWCLMFAGVVIYCGYCYGIIHKGIERMNAGDLNEKIDTKYDGTKLLGGLCETVGQVFYMMVVVSDYKVGLVIISAYCALSFVWSAIFLKEKLSAKHYMAIAAAFIGIVILGIYDI
jgi:uncharacterized membrane protein